tara:strand:- start:15641 stop:16735 length:1095 start_codon:yes stop_codon:yes gene_type:complete
MKFIFLLLILLAFSCSRGEEIDRSQSSDVEFPVSITEFTLDKVQIANVLFKENKILTSDNHLISMNINSDTLFRVFELPNYTYKGAFGVQGQGPNEYYYPESASFNLAKGGITTGDLKTVRLLKLPLSGKVNDQRVKTVNTIKKPSNLQLGNKLIDILDGTILCASQIRGTKKHLICYDSSDNTLIDSVSFPSPPIPIHKNALANLFINSASFSNDKDKFVVAYSMFPMIRIVDLKTGSTITKTLKSAPAQKEIKMMPGNGTINSIELISYYSSVKVTSKYIYAIYQPKERFKKELLNESGNIGTRTLGPRELHVFDWEGNPILKIEQEDWMYTLTPLQDDSGIIYVHPEVSNFLFRLNLPNLN